MQQFQLEIMVGYKHGLQICHVKGEHINYPIHLIPWQNVLLGQADMLVSKKIAYTKFYVENNLNYIKFPNNLNHKIYEN